MQNGLSFNKQIAAGINLYFRNIILILNFNGIKTLNHLFKDNLILYFRYFKMTQYLKTQKFIYSKAITKK